MLAAIADQPLLNFQQRDVGLTTNETQQISPVRFDPVRPPIPARRRRRDFAGSMETTDPAYRAGYTDPETLGRRVARHAPSITASTTRLRSSSESAILTASFAASLKNHKRPRFGKPP